MKNNENRFFGEYGDLFLKGLIMLNYLVFIDCNLKTSLNFSEIITMSDHASKTECKQILIINDVRTQHVHV